jgi:uncharacterized protein DUF4400
MLLVRLFAIALAVALVLVLYLPSANPPERFLQQIRIEHDLNRAYWGADVAIHILDRALSLYSQPSDPNSAALSSAQRPPVNPVNEAVSRQMAETTQRLFGSSYFQGVEAILLLATYRLSALVQWLPFVSVFILIACFDGYIVRVIRSKEFLEHSPMRFGLFSLGAILTFALTLVAWVIPISIHPLVLGVAPLLVGAFGARAISHFHP